jgi:putative sterol carrier protein
MPSKRAAQKKKNEAGDIMDEELRGLMTQAIDKFNCKAKSDEKLKAQLADMDRRILVEFHDCDPCHMHLKDLAIKDFADGNIDSAEVKVVTDQATMKALLKKEINAMKAYATGKIKFKASLTDILTLKKLFSD